MTAMQVSLVTIQSRRSGKGILLTGFKRICFKSGDLQAKGVAHEFHEFNEVQ
jgi:hypothetical protein